MTFYHKTNKSKITFCEERNLRESAFATAVHSLILEKRGGAYSEEGERGILVKQWMVAFAKRAHLE